MNAENIITVLVAIIGSGALSATITLVAARFRHDRQVDQLEAWVKELELLEQLERRAGLNSRDEPLEPRSFAVVVAARSQLRSTIAKRLVPSGQGARSCFASLVFWHSLHSLWGSRSS